MSSIEVTGVRKSYGAVSVLDSINLSVADGSKTVIVGSSGSGKTTLLRLLSGFEFPDAGSIRIDGRTVAGRDASGMDVRIQAHRRQIGYVAQDGALFPHLSVGENIAFGLAGVDRRLRQSRVQELLELVSLDSSLQSRRPDQLSGGQQQRVALARALAREPKVMLLDEPFSALDFALRATTRDLVSEALTSAGITTVLVTHDRAEALAFGDQLAVLRDGRLVQVGSPRELYSTPADVSTARFLGDAIILRATVDDTGAHTAIGTVAVAGPAESGSCVVMLRPEQLVVRGSVDGAGRVTGVEFSGPEVLLTVHLVASDETIRVAAPVSASVNAPVTAPVSAPGAAVGSVPESVGGAAVLGVGDRVDIYATSPARVFAAS